MGKSKISYASSGVSIDEGNTFVEKIKSLVAKTMNENVPENIGGFAGLYNISSFKNMEEPMLISSTDGVGTKLKLAFLLEKYDTIGIDLVAMCVNDLIVTGARPLFFLDYIATGKLRSDKMVEVIKGITYGCLQASVALLGGETAEMPGMYNEDEFDLAGFSVGIIDSKKIIDGKTIKKGDLLIGLKSSGFHSNGYSLVRKIFLEYLNKDLNEEVISGRKLGDLLLEPTRIYVKDVLSFIEEVGGVKGMVHITGGGFYDNLPRVIKSSLGADIYPERFYKLDIYEYLKSLNIVEERELYRVFNMGVGFIIVIDRSLAENGISYLNSRGVEASIIGEINDTGNIRIKGVDF
ncbi:MAG: phosphoribosylformylglycinamidine cyclo-ligase [Deferribacterales bacterium]